MILRSVVEAVLGPIDPRPLQPQTDELDRMLPGGTSGWSEVRAWCERQDSLTDLFEPFVGDPLDLLVIALDLDIAIAAGIEKNPANLKGYDAKALCRTVKKWLGPIDERVIICIPVMSVEAWILAALFPRQRHPEHERTPAHVLVDRKKLTMGRTGPWKRASDYRAFASTVVSRLKRVRSTCGEANRFVRKVESIAV